MAVTHRPKLRPVTLAVIIAGVLMLGFGLTYRVLAARMGVLGNRTSIDPGALEGLPLQIGDWTGQGIPVDETIIDAAGVDAYINRRYSRQGGVESVSLFAACGTNVNEVMSHRPLGCYRAAGWTLVQRRAIELPIVNEVKLPCMVYQFYRKKPVEQVVTVLHYCRADGQYFDEVMQVLAERWGGLRTVRYAAQVQIVASGLTLEFDPIGHEVFNFAAASAAPITHLFTAIEKGLPASESLE